MEYRQDTQVGKQPPGEYPGIVPLHLLGACYMLPGVDYPVYSCAGESFPSKRLFHGVCKWCARAEEARAPTDHSSDTVTSSSTDEADHALETEEETPAELAAQASGGASGTTDSKAESASHPVELAAPAGEKNGAALHLNPSESSDQKGAAPLRSLSGLFL